MALYAKVRITTGQYAGLVGSAFLESQGKDKPKKIRFIPPASTLGVRNQENSRTLVKPENIVILEDDHGVFDELPDVAREIKKGFNFDKFTA